VQSYFAKTFLPVLSDKLKTCTMNKWEGIFEKWRRFLFITYQITKTSLIFSKCAMVRELFDIEVVLRNVLLKLCFKTVELAFLTS
jgi:hypothetical protein